MSMSTSHPGDVYAHSAQHVAELRVQYPQLFEGPFISCSWPDGWHGLVSEICAYAHKHAPDVRWTQIKEKFGELHLYFRTVSLPGAAVRQTDKFLLEDFQKAVTWVQARSIETCVLCGESWALDDGDPHANLEAFAGWWLSRCPRCHPLIEAHRLGRGSWSDV